MPPVVLRAARFVVVGALTTGVAYVTFMLFLKVTNYLLAASGSWVITVGVGFVLNRRFTFGLQGPDGAARHLTLYIVCAALQYVLTMVGYYVMIGVMRLDATLAFAINLVLASTFSFTFLNLVTFKAKRGAAPVAP